MNDFIPEHLKSAIPKLYETQEEKDPIVHIKLFLDGWTWYITEISKTDNICFGYVISPFCKGELGYFDLDELKSLRGRLGTWVERDIYFKRVRLSAIKGGKNDRL